MSADLPALLGGHPIHTRPVPAWPRPTPAARDTLLAVFDSGHWWQSGAGWAERLENWLAEQFGGHAVAVATGTLALETALVVLGIGAGDEVLVPAATFVATATAVSRTGAIPVPVDVDPATLLVDLDRLDDAVTGCTAALIVVHLAGSPVPLAGARAWCDRRGLALIEDCAQAVSAEHRHIRVGTVGDAAVVSFQAAKLLPGGDGGAVIFRAPANARYAELYANNGRARGSSLYQHELAGTNARISEWVSALVVAAAGDYDQMWALRDATARGLDEALHRLDRCLPVGAPAGTTRRDHYLIALRRPAALAAAGITTTTLAAALTAEGLPARQWFPAWNTTAAYTGSYDDSCPAARAAAVDVVWLHHAVLLDPVVATTLPAALDRITNHVGQLAAWQRHQTGRAA